MTTSKPAKKNSDRATQEEAKGHASQDKEGGVPAMEEDIGTEGAGTEPRGTGQAEGKTGTAPKDKG